MIEMKISIHVFIYVEKHMTKSGHTIVIIKKVQTFTVNKVLITVIHAHTWHHIYLYYILCSRLW